MSETWVRDARTRGKRLTIIVFTRRVIKLSFRIVEIPPILALLAILQVFQACVCRQEELLLVRGVFTRYVHLFLFFSNLWPLIVYLFQLVFGLCPTVTMLYYALGRWGAELRHFGLLLDHLTYVALLDHVSLVYLFKY